MKRTNKGCKILLLGLGGCLIFCLAACRNNDTANKKIEQEIITQDKETEKNEETSAPVGVISMPEANKYFEEIDAIIQNDNGRLWGRLLETPFLFVDGVTGNVVANEADEEGLLTQEGSIYIGTFPEDSIVANSVTKLGGKEFAMVQWDDYSEPEERKVLFLHELFHYHQLGLGLTKADGMELVNSQLDECDGRIYLRLEWAALYEALNSTGSRQVEAISDALAFRQYRRDLYGCESAENELIIREGLPEYTGIKLAMNTIEKQISRISRNYDKYVAADSYVRSFPYCSGPLYGFLLDELVPNWKQGLSYNSDLGKILAEGRDIEIATVDIEKIAVRYGSEEISKEEEERKEILEEQILNYERLLMDGPTVEIKLISPNIGFNPASLIPYKDLGTIYPQITIVDEFGKLELMEGGCLLSNDWSSAVIPAENVIVEGGQVKGNGWSIELNQEHEIKTEGDSYFIY